MGPKTDTDTTTRHLILGRRMGADSAQVWAFDKQCMIEIRLSNSHIERRSKINGNLVWQGDVNPSKVKLMSHCAEPSLVQLLSCFPTNCPSWQIQF